MAVARRLVRGLGSSRARMTSASLTRSVRATHRANAEPVLRTGLPIPVFSRAIVGSTQTAAKVAIARRACSTNSASVRAPRCAVLIPLAHRALASAATAAVTATFVIPRTTPASTTATAQTARATTILSRSDGPARSAYASREGFASAAPPKEPRVETTLADKGYARHIPLWQASIYKPLELPRNSKTPGEEGILGARSWKRRPNRSARSTQNSSTLRQCAFWRHEARELLPDVEERARARLRIRDSMGSVRRHQRLHRKLLQRQTPPFCRGKPITLQLRAGQCRSARGIVTNNLSGISGELQSTPPRFGSPHPARVSPGARLAGNFCESRVGFSSRFVLLRKDNEEVDDSWQTKKHQSLARRDHAVNVLNRLAGRGEPLVVLDSTVTRTERC